LNIDLRRSADLAADYPKGRAPPFDVRRIRVQNIDDSEDKVRIEASPIGSEAIVDGGLPW
jgi:hypothetical protein